MSATDGSPTKTGWKRRSSAASFSMCLRYSSSVVAPTARSSPRASIGFSMFAASTAPSAAPAPTIVCSSSMKRTISPGGVLDLGEHGLQPLLELAAVLRAGEERADVERPDALALQPLGDVAGDDPLREALDDRGLADAGLADQHRVVLRPAREHLDHAADLLVAADDGVELAVLGQLGQVAAELLERLVGALGILRGDALPAAHVLHRREQLRRAGRRRARAAGARSRRSRPRASASPRTPRRGRAGTRPTPAGWTSRPRSPARAQPCLRLGADGRHVGRGATSVARQLLVEQREQQVLGVDLGVAGAARELLGGGDRLLTSTVSLLKSSRALGRDAWRRLVEHDLAPVGAVHGWRSRRASRARAAPAARAPGAARPRARSTCSTPARLSPSSVVSRWIRRSRSRSASE